MSRAVIAWAVAVLASDLPDLFWQARTANRSSALLRVKTGALVGLILSAPVSAELRALRTFFVLMLVLMLGMKARRSLRMTARDAQNGGQPGWVLRMAASMGMGLFLAAVMVVVLLVAGKERQEVFLVIGDLDGWRLPGVGLALGLMVVTYFFFDYHLPSRAVITNALPLLLPALVFAGLLALNEEIMFRATLLSSLNSAVGDNQAVMMTVFAFGMAHYLGGTPANASGAVVTAALGWLWATIMLETGGIFLSWFIHFMNNVPTVVFWALSASSTTTPGPTD